MLSVDLVVHTAVSFVKTTEIECYCGIYPHSGVSHVFVSEQEFLPRLLHFSEPVLKALWRADAASLKPSAVAETVYVSLPNSRTLLVETQPAVSSDIDKIPNL